MRLDSTVSMCARAQILTPVKHLLTGADFHLVCGGKMIGALDSS